MVVFYKKLVAILTSLFTMTASFPIFAFLSIIQFLQGKLLWSETLHSDIPSFSKFLNIWVWFTWFSYSSLSLLECSPLPAKMQFLILFGNSQHPSSRYPVKEKIMKKHVNHSIQLLMGWVRTEKWIYIYIYIYISFPLFCPLEGKWEQ